MLQPLNFFAPYDSLPAGHENQLTRALLVVLQYCPLVHSRWLSLVDDQLRFERLPEAQFRTQQARPATAGDDSEAVIRGISVFLTPDLTVKTAPVAPSTRLQILDGIIQYGDDLVVVIENKIFAGSLSDQPAAINTYGARIEFDSKVVHIAWQMLLEMLSDISARNLVAGAERRILDDFLDFSEAYFPHVGPFSTLRRAAKSYQRINKRLENVLAEAVEVPEQPGMLPGRRLKPLGPRRQRCVEMAFLKFQPELRRVELLMYPGDTLSQARELYTRRAAVLSLLQLAGWTTRPNYHWGFITSGLCWATGDISVDQYIDFWTKIIRVTRIVPREDWESYWAELKRVNIVTEEDKVKFDATFTSSAMETASPRPGLECAYYWPLDKAMQLDDAGRFVDEVRHQVLALLTCLGEPLIP